jgi:FAD/FMN-containing dehydrogenase/Fe-S oxidoreductase
MTLPAEFAAELRKRFTGEIRIDRGSRILYSTDASIYQIEPLGIAIPRTQDDLHAAVELASKYSVPILARGSGTSLAGQAIGPALILDCSRWLDKILEIDPVAKTARVEPGVILTTLNRSAAEFGLEFGPDPASAERATMGGVLANNATGAHSILYGMAGDHLLSADVIQADGALATWSEVGLEAGADGGLVADAAREIRIRYASAIKEHYPRSWRNSAGYRLNYLLPWSASVPPRWTAGAYPPVRDGTINLAKLLAGSEGTLAVIRRATVNLVPKPEHAILGILSYPSIAEACEAVPEILKSDPSAVELIPRLILRLARAIPEYAKQMAWARGDPPAVLVVEFSGAEPQVLRAQAARLGEGVILAESNEDQQRVWNVRKVGLGILDSRPQSARPVAFIEDCAIPVENLSTFIQEIERMLKEHDLEAGIYAHASAGCLHIRPILDLKTNQGVHDLREIARSTLLLTLRLGGSMASEHGDGIARGEWLEQTYGPELIEAMRLLKHSADPKNLLNPHKMFDAPPMDTNLRYSPNQPVVPWSSPLDFEGDGGMVLAIEQCNGQGVCRKAGGVMCPSFQATREEQHSTRGRANLLRGLIAMPQAITQAQKAEHKEMVSAVAAALDLCLACKGCMAECPSGVDMAKLKFAFEAEYYKTHPRDLRDYLFGYFHLAARVLAYCAPLTNLASGIGPLREFGARMLGITTLRPFPKFTSRQARVRSGQAGQTVLFLSDPYSRFIDPHVEASAFDLLYQVGLNVKVLPVIGAGASLLAKGFLRGARRHAESLLDALKVLDPECSFPLVGVEPPEIYTLKDYYFDLLPQRKAEISKRLSKTWLLDEFLIRLDNFKNMRVVNKSKIYFHPHCHQKAAGPAADGLPIGTEATMALLRGLGYAVDLIDAGCCGMAGTFGYEAEHYDLSQRVGGLRLFPFVRRMAGGTLVSTGAACRMQIVQGTGKVALHPIELISNDLLPPRAEA